MTQPMPAHSAPRAIVLDARVARALIDVAIESAVELERLTRLGVLTEECRNFPSEAQLERVSPGYRARQRALHVEVQRLSSELFERGASLLLMLEQLRAVTGDAMRRQGVRPALQQLVLAEVSTACVAASYAKANRAVRP